VNITAKHLVILEVVQGEGHEVVSLRTVFNLEDEDEDKEDLENKNEEMCDYHDDDDADEDADLENEEEIRG
jgi:hypothetical protein